MMSVVAELIPFLRSEWGWLIVFGYFTYQLYWPFGQTKIQEFAKDVTTRLERIEVTQVALAQEVDGVSDEVVAEILEHDELDPSDLKYNGSNRDVSSIN